MGNKTPVDQEVIDWAKEVLGVGDENVGKIDEMRETLAAAAAEEATETSETETTEAVDP